MGKEASWQKPKRNGISYGADPEFVMCKDGHVIEASELYGDWFNSGLSCDGDHTLGEIRPYPTDSALRLVGNIRYIFNEAFKKGLIFSDVWYKCGHFKLGLPLGAHIHICGFPKLNATPLMQAIHDIYMILSDLIDSIQERELRANEGYGLGSEEIYRPQQAPSESMMWVEYRLPCSWILSPEVAFVNLYTVQAVVELFGAKKYGVLEKAYIKRDLFQLSDKDLPDNKLYIHTLNKILKFLPLNWNANFIANWKLSK